MAINKKLIHFKTFAAFKVELDAGNILETSIVWIKDKKQIYTHGEYYDCSSMSQEDMNKLEAIILDGEGDKFLTNDGTYKVIEPLGNIVFSYLEIAGQEVSCNVTFAEASKLISDGAVVLYKDLGRQDNTVANRIVSNSNNIVCDFIRTEIRKSAGTSHTIIKLYTVTLKKDETKSIEIKPFFGSAITDSTNSGIISRNITDVISEIENGSGSGDLTASVSTLINVLENKEAKEGTFNFVDDNYGVIRVNTVRDTVLVLQWNDETKINHCVLTRYESNKIKYTLNSIDVTDRSIYRASEQNPQIINNPNIWVGTVDEFTALPEKSDSTTYIVKANQPE